MTKTHQEIATDKDIQEILSQDEALNEGLPKFKLDFGLVDELYNEFTMILGSLRTLCRAFIDQDSKLITGLPDLMLVNIQSGKDALNRIWDEVIKRKELVSKQEKAPDTDASQKDSPGA